jgi:hypothetical protein
MRLLKRSVIATTILFLGTSVSLEAAEDSILGISIIGNKESPRVLTIVPWRQPLADGIEPEVIPIWKPELKLLAPDSYIRDIDLFLEQRQLRLKKIDQQFNNANQ